MLRRRVLTFSAIALSAVALAGCTSEIHQYMRFPDFLHPGSTPYQRSVGLIHDPYPLNDVGPPVEGSRPPSFKNPVPEVDRSRLLNPPKSPLKPLPIFAPAIVTPQVPASPWPPAAPLATPAPAAPVPYTSPTPYSAPPIVPQSPYPYP